MRNRQSHLAVFYVADRGDEIVARRKTWCAPVGVEHRPIFQVHVGIADGCVEDEPADEFGRGFRAKKRGDVARHVRIAVVLVLVVRKLTVDLIEILHVNSRAFGRAVEPPHVKRIGRVAGELAGQTAYFTRRHKSDLGDVDADGGGELHHGILVFRNERITRRGQLYDPRTATAFSGNGELTSGSTDGREFELHAGQ